MFLENEYVRPLFDNINGGPPRAFECLQCHRVCRTERGIQMHLRFVHYFQEQLCLSLMENSNRNQRAEQQRKNLRVSPSPSNLKNLSSTPNMDLDHAVKVEQPQQEKTKKSGTKSLKPMREENSKSLHPILDGLNSVSVAMTDGKQEKESATHGTETK